MGLDSCLGVCTSAAGAAGTVVRLWWPWKGKSEASRERRGLGSGRGGGGGKRRMYWTDMDRRNAVLTDVR